MNARTRAAATAVATVCALGGTGGAAAACRFGSGTFSSVTPPSCTSPVKICGHGTLRGGFRGIEELVGDKIVKRSNGAQTLLGHSTIATADGSRINDSVHSMLVPRANGTSARFFTLETIAGGTGAYARASGSFLATAVLDFRTGLTKGTYSFGICTSA